MNLDSYARCPSRSSMPVRSLDLSKIYDCLGAASAIVIASLIGVNRR
jgi:hypothetical protein